jgi:hypothetical protein
MSNTQQPAKMLVRRYYRGCMFDVRYWIVIPSLFVIPEGNLRFVQTAKNRKGTASAVP